METNENTNTQAVQKTEQTTQAVQEKVQQPAKAPEIDVNKLAEQFMAAITERTNRAERGVVKSMAEQNGLTEEEVTAVLAAVKSAKAKQLPPEVQAQIDAKNKAANDRLIAAQIRADGLEMGIVDPDVAALLIDKGNVKISDTGVVTGVKDALTALQKAKPYLFGVQPTGQQVSIGAKTASGTETYDGVTAAFYELNPKLKRKK